MRTIGLVALVMCGCGGDGKDEESGDTAEPVDTDTPDTDDTDPPHTCVNLNSGTWTAEGTAFAATMTTTLTVDIVTCTFTLTEWSPAPATPAPTGGTLADETVTLAGDTHWESCTGAATPDGASLGGTCGDGTDFHIVYGIPGS